MTTTGAGRLVVQIDEARFVVDCSVKPVKLMGQVRTTFAPAGVIISCGGLIGPKPILNKVPLFALPPLAAVPYRLSPDIVKSVGRAPSLFVYGADGVAVKL